MKALFALLLAVISVRAFSQQVDVYPTHWFSGMKNQHLQIILHANGIGAVTKLTTNYPGVRVVKVNKVENKNYLFVDLSISPAAKPGNVTLNVSGATPAEIKYELKPRRKGNGTSYAQGVSSADFIYLLMPDRFSNADPANDRYLDMRDTAANRSNPFDRHGGDLKGVIDRLDYLKNLGVTSLWMTPVVENDMARTKEGGTSRSTYHGYAFTNQYKIDKRLGGNDTYKQLGNELHRRGMKLVQDAVYNHVGEDHWSIRDLPMKDWVNQWPAHQNTSYKDQPLVDPYASQIDKNITLRGWFTPFLADLNQRNSYVSNFLVQYAVWATEEFGVDAWRVDTYFYSEPEFLIRVNKTLVEEFPSITIFGEAWVHNVVNSAFFAENNINTSVKHNTHGITDFPLYFAMLDALNQPFGWTEGVNRLYNTLAQDIAYKDAFRNCIFLDNHDLDRIFSLLGEDVDKMKTAINWLLTLRGIPQLYYGTEILMKNFKNPTDAEVRKDFPGGWKEDSVNKFVKEGRTPQENDFWNHISVLANFRRNSAALTKGRLMQYLPDEGLFTYFRYHPQQTVMVISHTGTSEKNVVISRFTERTSGFTKMKNVLTGELMKMEDFTIKPKQSLVLELVR